MKLIIRLLTRLCWGLLVFLLGVGAVGFCFKLYKAYIYILVALISLIYLKIVITNISRLAIVIAVRIPLRLGGLSI